MKSSLLVEPHELEAHLDDPRLRLIGILSPDRYLKGHIPGSFYLDASSLSQSEKDSKDFPISPQRASALLGLLGIQKNSRVVCYDDEGGYNASRLFFILEVFGHRKVQILNGGLKRWVQEGRFLTQVIPTVQSNFFNAVPHPEKLVKADWINKNLGNPRVVLVDARSRDDYAGNVSEEKVSGHIPGAIHIHWRKTIDEATSSFKKIPELRILFQGVKPTQEIVTYCRNGYQASQVYFAARLIGFKKVRVYNGSWNQWSRTPGLPVETVSDKLS